MKYIELSGLHGKGRCALVDDEDYEKVRNFIWWFSGGGKKYLYTRLPSKRRISMHRLILNEPSGYIDHKNHNTLDNQRGNLRLCSFSQNMANRIIRDGRKFKGIYFCKRDNNWRAVCKGKFIGKYPTPDLAACAYNKEAKKLWGEFSYLNEVDDKTLELSKSFQKKIQQKTYILTKPNSEKIVIQNLYRFARENGLLYTSIILTVSGKLKQHRGWKAERLPI